ncbi:MAG: hypothetical protein NC213_06085 [Acetobacter sp.]|nr:hypothetical protein [Bacteroides sp.]MCM1341295.1 hypothetical protein [Acetobacter sp.]MCM1433929.1 hypothetical protein [Clostridiales bacterium]
MNKNIKKLISLLTALVVVIGTMAMGFSAFGDDGIAIDEVNFPDYNFRKIILERFDEPDAETGKGDKVLSLSERDDTLISISGIIDEYYADEDMEIKTLKGIEFFTNLTNLYCGRIGLEELDVTQLSKLTTISCGGNYLTTLDLSKNFNLITVQCSDNDLEELILPENSKINMLHCYANNLTSIDTKRLSNITAFRCDQNKLTELDLTGLTKLTQLKCLRNHLRVLDLSHTAISNAVRDDYSPQNITVEAEQFLGEIRVPFANSGLTSSNYMGCSLDEYEDCYFDFDYFIVSDVSQISDGIDYECYPNKEDAADMLVHIDVERNFYQVDFYDDETCSNHIGRSFADAGEEVDTPAITNNPQCKIFDKWSSDLTNVNEDMSVYAVWKDNHNYKAVSLGSDGDTVSVNCSDCGSSYTVSFISVVNSKTGDIKFDANVDVTGDGYINAKDYAVLNKLR